MRDGRTGRCDGYGGPAPVAADYGNSGGNVQLYQLTASMNCNNPSLCASLGGFWAWGVFNKDGTFDAEVTFCDHMTAPGGFNGAGTPTPAALTWSLTSALDPSSSSLARLTS